MVAQPLPAPDHRQPRSELAASQRRRLLKTASEALVPQVLALLNQLLRQRRKSVNLALVVLLGIS